ncbi:hypothetical protein MIT9_P1233 [Methylomarinovum caldicuralii]|uniref:Uncharacterized protein n=1 Tax=Methylomarinovum caldicuralii TaxID=438856 RepID=A0AAU9BZ85_9GAMM|nr:hypothetical protein [Methylomarinovum caldicuralii]BCX81655.1 hypothetical protein MIT9_P1233 [Methylomarinovum caldicuralii]
MSHLKTSLAVLIVWGIFGTAAASEPHPYWRSGHAPRPDIHALLERQHARIEWSTASGRLSERQYRKLMRKHLRIVELEDRFSRDGWLSRKEMRVLHHKIRKLNGKIRKKSHQGPRPYAYDTYDRWHPHPLPPGGRLYQPGPWPRYRPEAGRYDW